MRGIMWLDCIKNTMAKATMHMAYVTKSRRVCLSLRNFITLTYTFSGTYLPKRPAGLTSRTMIKTPKTMELARLVEM